MGVVSNHNHMLLISAVLPTVNKRDYPIVAEHVPIGAWEKMVER